MAFDRRPLSRTGDDDRWRTPACVPQALPGRHPLDPEKWRAMERFTRTISQSFPLLEEIEGVGRIGGVSSGWDKAVGNPRRISGYQLGGSHRGRDVCSRKKGGKSVGNTKKGKGTKIMLMTD